MSWRELQQYIIGKTFLVDFTFIDTQGKLIEKYETAGSVKQLTNGGLFVLEREDGSIFKMPYDNSTISKSASAYTATDTTTTASNPDYIMKWKITMEANDTTEDIKLHGFVPQV